MPEALEKTVRLFRTWSVVMSRANPSLEWAGEQGLLFESPLPIHDARMGTNIGFASLHWEGDLLVADACFPYERPERLMLEAGDKLWFARDCRLSPAGLRLESLYVTTRKPTDDAETPLALVE